MRASARHAFAHYFSVFPISIQNLTPDYYETQYLLPEGEGGAHQSVGGFLREAPLPRPPLAGPNYGLLDMETEVRRAVLLGLDGFTYDMLSLDPASVHWQRLMLLLEAAGTVDPGFKIVLMPDMTSIDATQLAAAIMQLSANPNLYRQPDGSIWLVPFYADAKSAAWWSDLKRTLAASSVAVSLYPNFLSLSPALAQEFAPICVGLSVWAGNFPSEVVNFRGNVALGKEAGVRSMFPVTPQDFRPKDGLFWEASNSENFRTFAQAAIETDAEDLQFITWNDYSESTEIAPSTGIGYAFYDLAAYYVRWFKTRQAPRIERDALYSFHRNSLSTQAPNLTLQTAGPFAAQGPPPSDEVELVAFLTAPGTLEIIQGPSVTSTEVGAGLQAFRAPLRTGGAPSFRLIRSGQTVLQLQSATTVREVVTYQDLLYRAASTVTDPLCRP